MCFRFSRDKALKKKTRARRTAYKVVQRHGRSKTKFGPLHQQTDLVYRIGETHRASHGPWTDGQGESCNGQYVCLSLKAAKRMASRRALGGRGSRFIIKVAVDGFRCVSIDGNYATFTSVKFLKLVEVE